jgi:cell division protein FtsW
MGRSQRRRASRPSPLVAHDRPLVARVRLLLFGVGLLLGLAASPPLAERNGLHPFHYVERQAAFGMLALGALVVTSMMTPVLVRRLSVIGFALTLVALALLPAFGTDFGKGAVRWFSLGFGSVQPSEFLKPCFVVGHGLVHGGEPRT